MLRSMEPDEFLYALYELFQTLLGPTPVPEEGHPGYLEAMVSELLDATLENALDEMRRGDRLFLARDALWLSFRELEMNPEVIHELAREIDINKESCQRGSEFTEEVWRAIHCDLWDEFLWDEDWRIAALQDRSVAQGQPIADVLGIDMNTINRLPQTPTPEQLAKAEEFLMDL